MERRKALEWVGASREASVAGQGLADGKEGDVVRGQRWGF